MGFRGRVLFAGVSQLGRRGLEALHCVLPSEYDWSEGEGERRIAFIEVLLVAFIEVLPVAFIEVLPIVVIEVLPVAFIEVLPVAFIEVLPVAFIVFLNLFVVVRITLHWFEVTCMTLLK